MFSPPPYYSGIHGMVAASNQICARFGFLASSTGSRTAAGSSADTVKAR